MSERETRKNRTGGWIITFVVHAIIVALLMAFSALYPRGPLDDDEGAAAGIPSSLGFDDEGQTYEELPQEILEPLPAPTEEIIDPAPVDDNVEAESDDVPNVPPKDEPKPKEQPKETAKQVETKPKTENSMPRQSQGDKKKDGQQGSKDGNPDERNNMSANSGNGDKDKGGNGDLDAGPRLDIKGWKWDRLPTEQDPTSEVGSVKFKFSVDEDGNILNIVKENSANLTVTEVNFYRKQLEKVKFTWKDDNIDPPASTTGYYTFKILSR